MLVFDYNSLSDFANNVFLKMGCSPDDAVLASQNLLLADLRGIDSHGIARLAGYVRLWQAGRINTTPTIMIDQRALSAATVDGGGGLGLVVGQKAMQKAIEMATQTGVGWVGARNSNHFGIAATYAMMALQHDMIGICLTNASPLVAPAGSTQRMLGTNPIAVAIPAKTQPPFVADMATTTAANGKLEILERLQKPAPQGWIQTSEGNSTTDPTALSLGGSLLPLGSDSAHGIHKGYCLGALVDILSGVLSGANYGPWVPPFVSFLAPASDPVGLGIGHTFVALRVDAFRPKEDFYTHIDQWIHTFRHATAINPQIPVQIPGDAERIAHQHRSSNGINLNDKVIENLDTLANQFDLKKLAKKI